MQRDDIIYELHVGEKKHHYCRRCGRKIAAFVQYYLYRHHYSSGFMYTEGICVECRKQVTA